MEQMFLLSDDKASANTRSLDCSLGVLDKVPLNQNKCMVGHGRAVPDKESASCVSRLDAPGTWHVAVAALLSLPPFSVSLSLPPLLLLSLISFIAFHL